TLSAPRSPKPIKSLQTRKGKVLGESSESRKPIRIKITTKRQEDLIIHVSTYIKIKTEHLSEALDVSLAMYESAKEVEARENVDMVEKQILAKDVKKLVEGNRDNESFVDSLFVSQEDPNTRLETGSHKESSVEPVNVIDDDEDDNN
nr:hypothetical protein [Tanacetum cinerariifolium]